MKIKRYIALLLAKISMIITVLIFSYTATFANSISHTHGDRSHSHSLPANGLSHRHGSLPPANQSKGVAAPVTNNNSFSVSSNNSNCNNAKSCWSSALLKTNSNNNNGAASDFKKSCGYGKAKACVMAGKLYFEKKQFKEARALYEKACYGKTDKVAVAAGCTGLADLHNEVTYALDSSGEYLTLPSTLELYERGCNAKAPAPYGDEVCRKYNDTYAVMTRSRPSSSSSNTSGSSNYNQPSAQEEKCTVKSTYVGGHYQQGLSCR